MSFKSSVLARHLGAFLLTFSAFVSFAQDVDILSAGGFAPSPLVAGSTNQLIFGVQLHKNAGGMNVVTGITVLLSADPTGIIQNPRIYRSTNNTFGVTDALVDVGTLGTGPNRIDFSDPLMTNFGNDANASDRWFFVVVDIDPNTASTTIQPSVTETEITVSSSSVNSGSFTGTDYTINALETSIGSLNAGGNGVAASPLAATATNQAIFGFSLSSNGDQTVTDISIPLSSDPAGKFTSFTLVRSTDNNFATTGNNTVIGAMTASPIDVSITGLNEDVSSTRNYFVVATVDPAVTTSTPTLQASLSAADITVDQGSVTGSATGTDYSFEEATVTINQLTNGVAGSPLNSAATDQALLGFSLTSNGAPTFTAIDIQLSSTTTGKLSNIRLFSSTDNTFSGGDTDLGATVTITPTEIQFSSLAQSLSTTARNYFVVADIEAGVNNTTPSIELSFNEGHVTVSAGTLNTITVTGTNYSFVDSSPPIPVFNPDDGDINVSVTGNITITFNEAIRNLDNSAVTPADLQNLIELKETNNGGTPVPFTASIDGTNQVITIDPNANLSGSQVYYVEVNALAEDIFDNAIVAESITFTTEAPPAVTSFTPTSTCEGESVTITGQRFGLVQPEVRINGAAIPPANITSFNNTQIIFNIPVGATTGKISVVNNANGLVSPNSASDLTVLPAINTGLSVTPNTTTPNQGTEVTITVSGAQSSVTYTLVLVSYSGPGSVTLGTKDTDGSGSITLETGNLTETGTYNYKVTASRAGCTTQDLVNTVVISVAQLSVDAGSDKAICAGENTIIGGSPTALGGSGFHSISWSGPGGFSSNNPNPTVSVAGTYTVTVDDSNGNGPIQDDVIVTVNPLPTVAFDPSTRNSFFVNETPYQLTATATPSDGTGVFSGTGVVQYGGGNYFFHPDLAGVQNDIPITYTHTNTNGCSNDVTILVSVSSQSAVLNHDSQYCSNSGLSGILAPNPATIDLTQYRRMRFLDAAGTPISDVDPNYPLIEVPASNPKLYRLDPARAAIVLGGEGSFLIGVYGDVFLPILGGITLFDVQLGRSSLISIVRPGIRPVITSIQSFQLICQDAGDIILETSTDASGYTPVAYTVFDLISNTTVSPNPVEFVSGEHRYQPDEVTYPSNELYRYLRLDYEYEDNNGCAGLVSTNFYNIRKLDAPTALGQVYCQFYDGPLTLSATGEYGDFLWYSNVSLSDPNPGRGPIFDTGLNSLSPVTQTFYVTDNFVGCASEATAVDIQVTPVPNINLTIGPQCEDRVATLQGPSNPNIVTYEWNLGDGTTASTQTVEHVYQNQGLYDVKLRVVFDSNGQDCPAEETTTVTVGPNPIPNFTFNQLCDGDVTSFNGSANIAVERFEWIFGDGDILISGLANNAVVSPNDNGGRTGGTYRNPTHQYITGPGDHFVRCIAYTNLGCNDTTTKRLTILPYLTFDSSNPYDMTSLDGGRGFWTTEDKNGNSTWEFSTADKPVIKSPDPAWVTNAAGPYLPNDVSYVNSPCLNIAGFTKPALSINYISNTQKNFDGAVLEYSLNGGVTWNNLGAPGTGLAWFNQLGFIGSNVGSGQVGWSGDLWEVVQNDTLWMDGRRAIDDQIPVAQRSKVRFRIAFGSSADGEFDGFAFNNVKIEERNRIMLVENFTNESAPNYSPNNATFKTALSTESVKLQYHLSYPGADPINVVNSSDPNARAAFYGLTSNTQLIPRAYIDGGSLGDFTTNWYSEYAALRSLKSSPFAIIIGTQPSGNPEEIVITTSVTALQDVSVGKPILHVAIVEKTVGDNEYVLRKLLPSATGTAITLPLDNGETHNAGPHSWAVTSAAINPQNLAIVAFVQDENTKEVYQAAILENPANLPTVVTGLEPSFFEQVRIYPNPSDKSAYIRLPAPAAQPLPLKVYDSFGRELHNSEFKQGEQLKMISTQDFAGGIYYIQFRNSKGDAVRKKLLVVHN